MRICRPPVGLPDRARVREPLACPRSACRRSARCRRRPRTRVGAEPVDQLAHQPGRDTARRSTPRARATRGRSARAPPRAAARCGAASSARTTPTARGGARSRRAPRSGRSARAAPPCRRAAACCSRSGSPPRGRAARARARCCRARCRRRAGSGSNSAGSASTISLGRPVLPPDAIAWRDGEVRSGSGASEMPARARSPRPRSARRAPPRRGTPTTSAGFASARIAARSFRQPPRDRLRHRAELPDREARGHELGAVGQRDRDEVALLHAARGVGAREPVEARSSSANVHAPSPHTSAVRPGERIACRRSAAE